MKKILLGGKYLVKKSLDPWLKRIIKFISIKLEIEKKFPKNIEFLNPSLFIL